MFSMTLTLHFTKSAQAYLRKILFCTLSGINFMVVVQNDHHTDHDVFGHLMITILNYLTLLSREKKTVRVASVYLK